MDTHTHTQTRTHTQTHANNKHYKITDKEVSILLILPRPQFRWRISTRVRVFGLWYIVAWDSRGPRPLRERTHRCHRQSHWSRKGGHYRFCAGDSTMIRIHGQHRLKDRNGRKMRVSSFPHTLHHGPTDSQTHCFDVLHRWFLTSSERNVWWVLTSIID